MSPVRTDTVRQALLADLDKLRDPQGYLRAGWPRYHTLFGRDSLISAWQTLRVDSSIARSTLQVLASYQGRRVDPVAEEEPGKILHEHRFDSASRAELPGRVFPYYGSVDSTPLFLVVAGAYLATTGDAGFLEELWHALVAAHTWMTTYGDPDRDGFLEYKSRNPSALFHQGWKDGSEDHLKIRPPVALVEVQGYAYAAHLAFAEISRSLARRKEAEEALDAAERLRVRVNHAFWWPEQGTFYLALDGAKRPRAAVTSNPGHLLATGVVDTEKIAPLVRRLFARDLWTSYGIRTHSTAEPDFDPYGYHTGTVWPHDNWFLYRALRAVGYAREADQVREALFRAYSLLGEIPELYAVVDDHVIDLSSGAVHGTQANPIQAWSLGALLDMASDEGAIIP